MNPKNSAAAYQSMLYSDALRYLILQMTASESDFTMSGALLNNRDIVPLYDRFNSVSIIAHPIVPQYFGMDDGTLGSLKISRLWNFVGGSGLKSRFRL
ncbi:MAG: hypothetical protein LH631_14855 [Alkalinema sp. CAN_BIN05]|nr:hypothetical protein [Alkalinema sp. CAN_BIN05]